MGLESSSQTYRNYFFNENWKVTRFYKYLQNFEGARTIYCRDSDKSYTFYESQLPEEENGFYLDEFALSKGKL